MRKASSFLLTIGILGVGVVVGRWLTSDLFGSAIALSPSAAVPNSPAARHQSVPTAMQQLPPVGQLPPADQDHSSLPAPSDGHGSSSSVHSATDQDRIARIETGQVVELKIRGFEADLVKLKGELKPMAEVAPLLTKAPSQFDDFQSGLTFVGAMPYGSPRSNGHDGLMRVYRSDSLGPVVLVEYDATYNRTVIPQEIANEQVNGHPASLARAHDSESDQSMSTLVWVADGRSYSLRIGKIDLPSIDQLRRVAASISVSAP